VELSKRGTPTAVLSPPSPVRERGTGGEEQRQRETEGETRLSVVAVGEEWRVYDEWWRNPVMRRYVEVVLEGGKHTVLYQDEISGDWFEQTP